MSFTIEDSLISKYEIIQPVQTNTYGNAHGGEIVKMMDEMAAITATRVSSNPCVTANISEVDFHEPVREGDIIKISSYVYKTGDTSLEVYVEVEVEKPDDYMKKTTTASFVIEYVAENPSVHYNCSTAVLG
jgi:acyl-CoA hydrolase